ncbi:MAG: DEAD/DEAH box helicase family protein [Firmicutes bacterium]|nr:DEAD/DEAH box helicase family protein [Bacillota bacterium]
MANNFILPQSVQLHDYQTQAVNTWINKNCRGIFDMATGTGKTFTGLAALAKLSQKLNGNMCSFIVAPYQHLVEQWVDDIRAFGVEPIICYSKYNWKKQLENLISDYRLGAINGYCVIFCNASFKSIFVQNTLRKLSGNTVLVVDEAHNFGSPILSNCLLPNFKYRLALSATLERFNDERGTKALYNYFGEKCISFGLEDAIDRGFLTPYKYYPIEVHLTDDEFDKYASMDNEREKLTKNNNGKLTSKTQGLISSMENIIYKASNKVSILKDIIQQYRNSNNILVYCGVSKEKTSNWNKENLEYDQPNETIRQIDMVSNMLGNELNMKISMYTSNEDIHEREILKANFEKGELQALVAIRCLDEGVNIPSITTAFILSSSQNPKEYVQRRGRVLRKFEGKTCAEIYDLVVLPPCPRYRQLFGNCKKTYR